MLEWLALPVLTVAAEPAPAPTLATPPAIALDLAEARSEPAPPAPPAPATPPGAPASDKPAAGDAELTAPAKKFGDTGFWTFNLGAAYANDFDGATDVAGVNSVSVFIASGLEFSLESAGWYFHQDGPDTGGISGSIAFRYHWFLGEQNASTRDWSLFGEAGIGLLGAFNEVPDGGTNFNFMPRLGGGATFRLTDSGIRLLVGMRWHHISNGRISGDTDNPARDAVLVHTMIMFPF
jgi:hypothetical protein